MVSKVRQRSGATNREKAQPKKKVYWEDGHTGSFDRDDRAALLPDGFVILYTLLLLLLTGLALSSYWALPAVPVQNQPNEFTTANARQHLEDLAGLGIRHVGSDVNEVQAKNLLWNKLEEIRSSASSEVEIELSLQYPDGHYYLNFLGGMTHFYDNLTNIVVRFSTKGTSPQHAFLINAHFDSALGSIAASDDAVSCATMLETLRCLSSEPNPFLPEHALIFLFNGAEETILQASHGFITQHPWAKQIRAFLNLEACGAGGKEIVFQTGPDHPWLAKLYAKSVPHPFASVVAQEIFQSGIIPSDTDFRVFRDYGHIPGIDTAYYTNGYIYHTEYDIPSAIPDGSIQRAGENVVALLREVGNSPLLADHQDQKHGKIVFFDLFGYMTVVFEQSTASVANIVVAAACLVTTFITTSSTNKAKPSLSLVISTFFIHLLAWLAALLFPLVPALVLTFLGQSMSWFAHPALIMPLYGAPVILALVSVHTWWIHKNKAISAEAMEKSCFLSSQLLWTTALVVCTYLSIVSAFVFLAMASFVLIFRTLFLDCLILQALDKKRNRTAVHFSTVVSAVCCVSVPLMWSVLTDKSLFDLFVPLTGRSGSVVPPDVAIAVLVSVFVSLATPYIICVIVYSSSKRLKKIAGAALLIAFVTAFAAAALGFVYPYSMKDPAYPKPKRFYLQHTDRTFHDVDGAVTHTDSRVFLNALDYLELKPIADASPAFREVLISECEGLYCAEPFYVPLRHVIKQNWYLPAPKLMQVEPGRLTLLSSIKTKESKRNFTFSGKLPHRAGIFIAPKPGHAMSAWSLETFVPPVTPCPGSYEEQGCFFVFYARGVGDGNVTFWIEIEGDIDSRESLEIAVATHYLDPPASITPYLTELLQCLPNWVTAIAWTSTYDSWVY